MDIKSILIAAAPPGLQVILNLAGVLRLQAFPQWEWDANLVFTSTYVITISAAIVGALMPSSTNKKKVGHTFLGLIPFVLFLGLYTLLSTNPPAKGYLLIYDIGCYLSFIGTYASFGFLVARVVKFYVRK